MLLVELILTSKSQNEYAFATALNGLKSYSPLASRYCQYISSNTEKITREFHLITFIDWLEYSVLQKEHWHSQLLYLNQGWQFVSHCKQFYTIITIPSASYMPSFHSENKQRFEHLCTNLPMQKFTRWNQRDK